MCPKCNQNSVKLKDTYLRKINHGLFIDRKCIVHYKQKRYKCSLCNHTFNEPCSLVQPHQKKSIASHLQLMELLKDPHLTFKKVAELLNLSTNTVIVFMIIYQNILRFFLVFFVLMKSILVVMRRRNMSLSCLTSKPIRLSISFMEEREMRYTHTFKGSLKRLWISEIPQF